MSTKTLVVRRPDGSTHEFPTTDTDGNFAEVDPDTKALSVHIDGHFAGLFAVGHYAEAILVEPATTADAEDAPDPAPEWAVGDVVRLRTSPADTPREPALGMGARPYEFSCWDGMLAEVARLGGGGSPVEFKTFAQRPDGFGRSSFYWSDFERVGRPTEGEPEERDLVLVPAGSRESDGDVAFNGRAILGRIEDETDNDGDVYVREGEDGQGGGSYVLASAVRVLA